MKKRFVVLAAAAVLSLSFASAAYAGWNQDGNGWTYQNESGSMARDQLMVIDGATYGFNQSGYMLTGWQVVNGQWHYFDPASGVQMTGWQAIGGVWYYMDPATGAMHTSWLKLGTTMYYLDPASGAMKTGYFDVDGLAYRTHDDGSIYRNTSEEDGNGNIFVYDDLGRIKIANSSTRNISKGEGGSAFQDFLSMANYDEWKNGLIAQSNEVVGRKKDELYVKYRKEMVDADSVKKRENRRTKWEANAKRQLEELHVSEEEINTFIQQTEWNTYTSYGDLTEFGYDDIDPYYEWNEDEDEEEDW